MVRKQSTKSCTHGGSFASGADRPWLISPLEGNPEETAVCYQESEVVLLASCI